MALVSLRVAETHNGAAWLALEYDDADGVVRRVFGANNSWPGPVSATFQKVGSSASALTVTLQMGQTANQNLTPPQRWNLFTDTSGWGISIGVGPL